MTSGSLVRQQAHFAIVASFLICLLPAEASDVPESRTTNGTEHSADSVSATSLPPDIEGRKDKSGKNDVDRIGQRSIGKGVNVYSLEKERSLGQAMASAIDLQTKFVADPQINEYVNRIAQKLVSNSDAQVPFTIRVIDSPALRTFALPGGFLYVDKGLIMEVDSEAELAGLMAHEIAHVAARHATRFATRKLAWKFVSVPLASLGPAGMGARPIGPLALKKFSRDSEVEADLLGLEYEYAAGYDPHAFVEALERLHGKELKMQARANALPKVGFLAKVPWPHRLMEAFSDYPPTEERILKVQTEISNLLPGRRDYIVDTSEFEEVKAKLVWQDGLVLRRVRPAEGGTDAPVLRRHPSAESEQPVEFRGASASQALLGPF